MIRKRKFLKGISIFMALEILVNTFLPGISYALTSGPTTPEVTSFEPVDVSNMVDMFTGDFNYTLPLLEVPGPAGSYPIALSYHAGINPDEDASWVGLGWNINTGALVRSVRGYPDDWQNVQSYTSEGWVGGTTDQIVAGLNVPVAPGISVTAGIIHVSDTYRGVGVGVWYGASMGVGGKSPASVGVTVNHNPYGGSSMSLNLGLSAGEKLAGEFTAGLNVGVSLNIGDNGISVGGNGGVGLSYGNSGYARMSLLGASISSNGGTNVSVGGVSLKSNLHTSGRVQSSTSSNLPKLVELRADIDPFITYKDERTVYNIDEHQDDFINGALYNYPNDYGNQINETFFDNHVFDNYYMFEVPDSKNPINSIDQPIYESGNAGMMGGSMIAYDGYLAMAQGIGGALRPYDFLQKQYDQNYKNIKGNRKKIQNLGSSGEISSTTDRPQFMLQGEYSNRYLYDLDEQNYYERDVDGIISYEFEESVILGDPNIALLTDTNNKIGRATDVKWYTNEEINSGIAHDLINPNAPGFQRNFVGDLAKQIGGYLITNPTGVTYHYALPAYSYDEVQYTENKNIDDGTLHTQIDKTEKYAYTWFLTGVTGPDYVDRGVIGKLDEADWGYWIEFEYGLWSPDYKWRNPSSGFNENLDANFQNYASGKKEIYYLNKVKTASHTAIFLKDERIDAKGLAKNGRTDADFKPTACESNPTLSLKLSEIILTKNEYLPEIDYEFNNSYDQIYCEVKNTNTKHFGQNMLLSENISATDREQINSKSIKTIILNSDYSLMPGTPNSFENDNIYSASPVTDPILKGKLTLNNIEIAGKGGEPILPPMNFEYKSSNEPYCKDCQDNWGSYKSDYNKNESNLNIKEMTTDKSAQSVDVWSLSKISTMIGSDIEIIYESDDFAKSIEDSKLNLKLSDLENLGNNEYKVSLSDASGSLNEYLEIGQMVNLFAVVAEAEHKFYEFDRAIGNCKDIDYFKLNSTDHYRSNVEVFEIGSDFVKVRKLDDSNFIDFELPYQYPRDEGDPSGVNEAYSCTDAACDLKDGSYTQAYRDFIGGELIVTNERENLGGGLRVKDLNIITGNKKSTTHYDYKKPNSDISSGVTSYIPYKLSPLELMYPEHYWNSMEAYFENENTICNGSFFGLLLNASLLGLYLDLSEEVFQRMASVIFKGANENERMAKRITTLNQLDEDYIRFKREQIFGEFLSKSSLIPSAGVNYEYVTISNSVTIDEKIVNEPVKTVHKFVVYDKNMLTISTNNEKQTFTSTLDENQVPSLNIHGKKTKDVKTRGISIQDITSTIGKPREVSVIDLYGKVLNEKNYHYLLDDYLNDNQVDPLSLTEEYEFQGVIDETFENSRFVAYAEIEKGIFENTVLYVINFNDEDRISFTSSDEELFTSSNYHLYNLLGTETHKRTFSNPLITVREKNYLKGITSKTSNLKFDFYTGSTLKTISTDSYGNYIVNETLPAYRKYDGMGLKMHGGANMLVQEASSKTYLVDNETNLKPIGLISANVQTWSDASKVIHATVEEQEGIYRKKAAYSWIGDENLSEDGLFNYNRFDEFAAWNDNNVHPMWQKNSEIMLFDIYSHALEAKDINGNFAATRFDPKQEQVIATSANASYNEMSYSGAEHISGNNLQEGDTEIGDGFASTVRSHTGAYSLQVAYGDEGFNYTLNKVKANLNKKYTASVWVYLPGESETESNISGAQLYFKTSNGVEREAHPQIQKNKSKSWYLIELEIDPNGADEVIIGCRNKTSRNVYFDDFRVHPLDAVMTSYVYDAFSGELTYILDANNFYTQFEYDGIGRLVRTKKESLNYDFGEGKESFRADKIIGETIYNYGKAHE